jgi:hypothetical protein
MIRRFVDAGVLIAAARGAGDIAGLALKVLDDPERLLLSSQFVLLEVLPKAVYHKQTAEAALYETYFRAVRARPRRCAS